MQLTSTLLRSSCSRHLEMPRMGGRSSCRASDFVRRRRWICRSDQAAARLLAQNHQQYYELSQSSAERMATSAAQGAGDMPVRRQEGTDREAQAAPGELPEQPHGLHCLFVGCSESQTGRCRLCRLVSGAAAAWCRPMCGMQNRQDLTSGSGRAARTAAERFW